MIAARPIALASAARPRHAMTAGSNGDSEKRGVWKIAGRRAVNRVPRARRRPRPQRKQHGHRDAPGIQPRAGDPAGNREQDHRQDVVDDRGAEDRATRAVLEDPELDQHGGGDADAGRHQRGGEEHRRAGVLAGEQAEAQAGGERITTPSAPARPRAGHLPQIRDARLEATQNSRNTTPSSAKTSSTSPGSTIPAPKGRRRRRPGSRPRSPADGSA